MRIICRVASITLADVTSVLALSVHGQRRLNLRQNCLESSLHIEGFVCFSRNVKVVRIGLCSSGVLQNISKCFEGETVVTIILTVSMRTGCFEWFQF